MTILDVNILIYAYHADTPHHAVSAAWMERALTGPDLVGIPLPVVWAFLRISTSPRVWPNPMTAPEAFRIMKELLALPGVILIEPGPRHIEILEALVTNCGATGPMVSDAVIAALAIEHGAVLATTDRDFRRFDNLRLINPLSD